MDDSIRVRDSRNISMTLLLESNLASVRTSLNREKSSSALSEVAFPPMKSFVIILDPSETALMSASSPLTGVVKMLALTPPVWVPILLESCTSEYSPAPVSIIMRVNSESRGASSRDRAERSTPKFTYAIPEVDPSSCLTTVTPDSFSFSLTAMGYSVTSLLRSLNSRLGMVARASGESSAACNSFNVFVFVIISSSSLSLREALMFDNLSCSSLSCSASRVLDGTNSMVVL
mmetsp:Transcript_27531/g.56399  ORF Transcript_27531/g.56399 Transcript_27531/m.56399 type:complete len:232 (-) Transcript_27531:1753-2448(-)